MKRIAFVVVAIMLPFSFAGCGASEGDSTSPDNRIANTRYTVPVDGDTDIQLYEVNINNTRCIVMDAANGGGALACDFN